MHLFGAGTGFDPLRMKPLRERAIKRKTVKPNKTKEDKIMTPARTNQNWLPGIFNEILGDNWLAERTP